MRRTDKEIKKLRLKIIELKKEGKTYEEIRRITSASPSTIAKILKNFKGRYCVKCGETNPEVLEENHPDKLNHPDYTITLCANCHEEITREQLRRRDKQQRLQENNSAGNQNVILVEDLSKKKDIQIVPAKPLNCNPQEIVKIQNYSANMPIISTSEILGIACLIGGLAGLNAALDQSKDKKERFLFFIISCANFWSFYKIWIGPLKK